MQKDKHSSRNHVDHSVIDVTSTKILYPVIDDVSFHTEVDYPSESVALDFLAYESYPGCFPYVIGDQDDVVISVYELEVVNFYQGEVLVVGSSTSEIYSFLIV